MVAGRQTIAYVARQLASDGEHNRLYTVDMNGKNPVRLGDFDRSLSANWSPDGTQLVAAIGRAPFTSTS